MRRCTQRRVCAVVAAACLIGPSAVAAQDCRWDLEPAPVESEQPALVAAVPEAERPLPASAAGDTGLALSATQTRRSPVRDFVATQRGIWLSPLSLRKDDLKWLLPLAAGTAFALSSDQGMSDAVTDSGTGRSISGVVSHIGAGYTTLAVPGTMFLLGRLKDNDQLTSTGLMGLEAVLHTELVVSTLKLATGRHRPDSHDSSDFGKGGDAFPSGHAAKSWALATVIAHQYENKPLVRWTAYGLAAAVSASRVTADRHFASDVLIGSTLGYLIGRHVVDRSKKGRGLVFMPYLRPSRNEYGVNLILRK